MREIETRRDMVKFFEKNLESGRNAEEIYHVLLNQGYSKSMINPGYNEAVANIKRKKDAQKQKELALQPKIEIVETNEPERKKGFFAKIFRN